MQEQFRALLTKVSTLDVLLDDLKEAGPETKALFRPLVLPH
jgi:hypothetical protein